MNSLTYFYAGYYDERENMNQTFDNIGLKHPLYHPIEHAVDMGIIKPTSKSFDVDSPIKREEIAAWYVRVDREVTYAELAVSTFRLAHEISDKRNSQNY
ncbi:hypothetical protein MHB48_17535 [Psychrobacillus sp. FSL H8-0483]|uniref:hypothetical protein n=1 Tax=Psychrobacillus sp. FSL H8-0483 TaxID=2921389 RepID=UPI00315A0E47